MPVRPFCPREEARFIHAHQHSQRRGASLREHLAWTIAFIITVLSVALGIAPAHAQNPVLSPGDAVVTGFSGIKPPAGPLPPGTSPLDGFFIDPSGVSAQILSLASTGAPPAGQLIAPPPVRQFKPSEIGQVFAIALDDGLGEKTPNIYLGATSAYGLHIVRPKDGGGFERLKQGAEGAEWMAGQFGPNNAGPGAIWKVDGVNGAVSLFARLDNSGPGLGDIAFDKAHRQFFVSDLDTGLIHRLSATGEMLGSFDHGAAGRPAKGLSTLADDGKEADISNTDFAIENPDSWGYTQPERMIWGLTVHDGRLYYALAVGRQVWSVGITEEGGFANDARWELDADRLAGAGPITDMLFDGDGRLYLAQRGKQRGSYDYSLFAEPEISSVARYSREQPDDPSTDSVWRADAEDYAIGMPPEHRHAEGGIALGFAHDEAGALRHGACGATLWATGHRLRSSNPSGEESDAAETGEALGTEADIHGLQGHAVALVRPQNTPPTQSYFTDYDGFYGDAAKSGHVGDVEIWQPCDGVAPQYGEIPPGYLPPLDVPPGDIPEDYPGGEYEANLRLVKYAWPRVCSAWGPGWLCRYRVVVRNTGPDPYFGMIRLRDWLPANPPGALMAFSPGWFCWTVPGPSFRCLRGGVFLLPGASVSMTVLTWVPRAPGRCELTNIAEIELAPGGSARNSDPSDDADGATAVIPDPSCRPGGNTNLRLEKDARPDLCWRGAGGDLFCRYMLTVTNTGPGVYSSHIRVRDMVPAGVTPSFSWGCVNVGGGFHDCTHPFVNLPPTGSRSMWVTFRLSAARARELECRVRNRARIIHAPGGTPMNTVLADDDATAVATVPAEICDQPPLQTNLRIKKEAMDGNCLIVTGDWCRTFEITLTNTGPGNFNTAISLNEMVPAGASVSTATPGWSCVGTTCSSTGSVALAPTASTSLAVTLNGSGELARELNCQIRNRVAIASPLGAPRNTDASDDTASTVASLPATFCQNQPVPSNLRITKAPSDGTCLVRGNNWCTIFKITVTNAGPAAFSGPIALTETVPAGATVSTGTAGWSCSGSSCNTAGPVTLPASPAPGSSTALTVVVRGSADLARGLDCRVTNQVAIADPLGAPRNSDAGDDTASASAALAASFCEQVNPTQCPPGFTFVDGACLRIGQGCPQGWSRTPVQGKCCPPGKPWNGEGCGRDDDTPPPPPTDRCEANMRLIDGQCQCGEGLRWNGRSCVPPTCPPGTSGKYPNCQGGDDGDDSGDNGADDDDPTPPTLCTRGRILSNGRCVCPSGMQWNGKLCVKKKCPEGTKGRWPQCEKTITQCGGGRVFRQGQCVCTAGRKWNGEECVRRRINCPPGKIGTPPNCRPLISRCPPGMIGKPPFCRSLKQFNPDFGRIPRRPREFNPNRPGGGQFGPRIRRLN